MQSGEMPMILAMYRRIGLSFHQDLCIWLLVLPILLCPLLRKIFSSPPLVFLGVISYGIYILHMPLVYLLHGATYAPLTGTISVDFSAPIAALGAQGLPVYWLAVIALATLCHLLIERPMIRFGHTVGQRIEAAASGDGLAQKG